MDYVVEGEGQVSGDKTMGLVMMVLVGVGSPGQRQQTCFELLREWCLSLRLLRMTVIFNYTL